MSELDRDLGAWAREELSREQLLAVHGAAAAALIAVHDRLTRAAAAVAVPSVEAGWATLIARIDAPAPPAVSPVTTAPALAGPSFGSHGGRSAPGPTASTVPPTASHRPSGSGASAHGGAGASSGIRGGGGGGSAKPADDPHDRDQGTGDDGSHNDHGSGNNGPEGSPPPESHGR
ncbi:MAG: hypothetical protein E6G43_10265 [Actinobacteria bacterium]|nr:MAG: hypothetical protein E6G43_10265 [Actinomycetota bacterium]